MFSLGDQTLARLWAALIALNFVAYTWYGWGGFGHHQIDTYQSSYVIAQIASGRLPYVDFSYYFGPLAVSLYGAALRLTGVHLEALYALGTLTAAFATLLLWRLGAELELPLHARGAVALLFVNGFVFNDAYATRLFNWVMPYCHSSTHAMVMLMLSLLFVFRWQRDPSRVNALAWGLTTSGVLLNRPDIGCVYAVTGALYLLRESGRLEMAWLCGLLPTLMIYGWFALEISWRNLIFENLFWVGHDPRINPYQNLIGAPAHFGGHRHP